MRSEIIGYKHQGINSPPKPRGARRKLLSKITICAELTAEDKEILNAAQQARDEWIETSANFEYVHEEMLVDYFTYKLKACESRYAYFVRLAKEKGLSRYI